MQALNHPLRISFMMELRTRGTLSANLHAQAIDQPLNMVSYHVKQLFEAELLELVKRVPRRGAFENIYRLTPGTPVFVLLDFAAHLLETQAEAKASENGHIAEGIQLLPMEVDEQGQQDLEQLIRQAVEESKRLALENKERLKREGKRGKRFDLGLGAFPRPNDEPEDGEQKAA